MAASSPAKLVLKSTTKMSLNDRFSAYRQRSESGVGAVRQMMHESVQTASRNRRLVQQLENRPSVIAALKLKKKSLRQRLGQTNGGGFDLQRLSVPTTSNSRPLFGFSRGRSRVSGRQFTGLQETGRAGASLKGRLGSQQPYGRGGATRRRTTGWDVRNRLSRGGRGGGRGGVRGGFRSRGIGRGQTRSNRGRGGLGGRFLRGRGRRYRGRGGNTQRKDVPSKQVLDNELDEYMAKSKGYLDAELESYMAQAHA